MQTRIEPVEADWIKLCERSVLDRSQLDKTVAAVFAGVAKGGDDALIALTEKYDGLSLRPSEIQMVLGSEKDEARGLGGMLKKSIDTAYQNIRTFHEAQATATTKSGIETQPGVACWRETRPIERVGLYVPGGTAPLVSTMLMLGVPAQLAGCDQVSVYTPPAKDGGINQAIRYAAAKCGISVLYTLGGSQAIAAATLGTQTVPKVDKLFGPGNQFVTAAKEYAQRFGVAIDMPAGPSEVLVLADLRARADFVAADLLSQAEHGPDSQVVLVTTSRRLQNEVRKELAAQTQRLVRREIVQKALENSMSVYFADLKKAFAFANAYAPEHWILQIENAQAYTKHVKNAGSVFVGSYSPESAGDYASGTNHTLPTAGWARTHSGVSLDSFQKSVTFQQITREGLRGLGSAVIPMAEVEGLGAHAEAVSIRLR